MAPHRRPVTGPSTHTQHTHTCIRARAFRNSMHVYLFNENVFFAKETFAIRIHRSVIVSACSRLVNVAYTNVHIHRRAHAPAMHMDHATRNSTHGVGTARRRHGSGPSQLRGGCTHTSSKGCGRPHSCARGTRDEFQHTHTRNHNAHINILPCRCRCRSMAGTEQRSTQ